MNQAYSIDDWAEGFRKLYEGPDSMRSPEEIWIATMAHCSSIGEAIRKYDYVELMGFAARAFCWMLSFSMKCAKTEELLFRCENTFSEMVYLKFPDQCGHCNGRPCDCRPIEMDAKKDKAGKYEALLEKWTRDQKAKGIQYTIHDWLEVFFAVYGGRIHLQTMETLGFHFLEEAGEESSAVRQLMQLRGVVGNGVKGIDEALEKLVTIPQIASEYIRLGKGRPGGKPPIKLASNNHKDIYARIVSAKMDSIVELADSFSFFCSILIKLRSVTIKKKKAFAADLEQMLIDTYGKPDKGLVCPTCHKDACECTFFSKPAFQGMPGKGNGANSITLGEST
jgi:hypothetical protein